MLQICFCCYLILSFCSLSKSATQTSTANSGTFVGYPGVPGSPGQNGSPGRDGRDGTKGERGVKGDKGERGEDGVHGTHGSEGKRGLPGVVGLKGINGLTGPQGGQGLKGSNGKIGPRGPQGIKGMKGWKGEKGGRGEKGGADILNWKQCVWFKQDGKDTGHIQSCAFQKYRNSSALHVAYAANMRVFCTSGRCCSRWYVTFNGQECDIPATIEGIVFGNPARNDPAHHRQIEGYCESISAGQVTVSVYIGNCKKISSRTYDGFTGWASMSRIMIQEVPPPQK